MSKLDQWEFLVFSCFRASLSEVIAAVRVIFAGRIASGRYSLEEWPLELGNSRIGDPRAGGSSGTSAIFYSSMGLPGSCIFVPDGQDGWQTLVNLLSRTLRCTTYRISTSLASVEYPFNSVTVYERGEPVRIVQAMLDGERWAFYTQGGILDFEDPAHYRKRKIAARLDRDIVVSYLDRLGIDVCSEEFWRSSVPAFSLTWHHF